MKDLKGKVLVGLASVSMLGGIALGSVQAFADFPNTGVEVQFNDDIVPPDVDPGVLELRAVPGFANFQTMTAGDNTQQVNAGVITGSGHVKLNDGREDADITGNREWQLSASASELVSGSDVIDDATIDIASTRDVEDWTSSDTDPYDRGTLGGPTATQVTRQDMSLTTDGTSEWYAKTTAGEKQGYAVPYDSMQLTVPSAPESFAGKTFEGTITWTLNDTVTP